MMAAVASGRGSLAVVQVTLEHDEIALLQLRQDLGSHSREVLVGVLCGPEAAKRVVLCLTELRVRRHRQPPSARGQMGFPPVRKGCQGVGLCGSRWSGSSREEVFVEERIDSPAIR